MYPVYTTVLAIQRVGVDVTAAYHIDGAFKSRANVVIRVHEVARLACSVYRRLYEVGDTVVQAKALVEGAKRSALWRISFLDHTRQRSSEEQLVRKTSRDKREREREGVRVEK